MVDMGLSTAERSRRYRTRKRGGPPRELQPCGTRAAYRRHLNAGEEACDACKRAESDHQHAMYEQRKAARKMLAEL